MTRTLESCYGGRTVLVTGHTGIKGAWLSAWLQRLGSTVVGYALPPEQGPTSLFEAARIGVGMTSILGDLRDPEGIGSVCRQHKPEIVFHLAAQSLVRRAHRDPVMTYATNVLGTVHLLEAVRAVSDVRAVVGVTSDKCYRERGPGPGFRETDPLGGDDPYSSSKGCTELVVGAYRKSFLAPQGVGLATGRAGNVIVGGDWAEDRLIPDLMRAVMDDRPAVLRNPEAVRPWQHALDPLYGYLLLGARLLEEEDADPWAGAWNFGPADGEAISVLELAQRVTARWDKVQTVIQPDAGAPAEVGYLQLDTTKARERLGWKPRLSTDDAIAWTVDWYRGFLDDPASASKAVADQLTAYDERLSGS